MPETTTTAEPRHQSGGLAVALAKLQLDALTGADAVADVATTAGENVTTAIRADLKEFKAETATRFTEVRADFAEVRADLKEFKAETATRFTEVNARVDGVAHSIQSFQKEVGSAIQSLQRENATIRWMIGGGFTLLGFFIAISTLLLRSSGSG